MDTNQVLDSRLEDVRQLLLIAEAAIQEAMKWRITTAACGGRVMDRKEALKHIEEAIRARLSEASPASSPPPSLFR